jgi:hypothetical protein
MMEVWAFFEKAGFHAAWGLGDDMKTDKNWAWGRDNAGWRCMGIGPHDDTEENLHKMEGLGIRSSNGNTSNGFSEMWIGTFVEGMKVDETKSNIHVTVPHKVGGKGKHETIITII